jgi:hypothetical protein
VRFEPQWRDATYEALARKRSNLQFGFRGGPIEFSAALDPILG